jgi:cytochrome c
MMIRTLAVAALAAALAAPAVQAADAAAAQAFAKKNNCMKCHSATAQKEGPSFKETAAKYKGQSDAEQKLVTHLTTSPTIKVGGKEEKHPAAKGDAAEVKNLAQWILSQ